MIYLYIAVGGAIGAVLRHIISNLVNSLASGFSFPLAYGTLSVNILGSFLIGVAFMLLLSEGAAGWKLFIITGFLGGFTTFSSFSLDTVKFISTGNISSAAVNILANVGICLIMTFVGIAVASPAVSK